MQYRVLAALRHHDFGTVLTESRWRAADADVGPCCTCVRCCEGRGMGRRCCVPGHLLVRAAERFQDRAIRIQREVWSWMQHSMHAEGCFLAPHHPDAPLKEPLSVMIMPRLEAEGATCRAVPDSVKRP